MSREADDEPEQVAVRMADAVAYLSAVARDAGLQTISLDLLRIRKKLRTRDKRTRPASDARNRKADKSGPVRMTYDLFDDLESGVRYYCRQVPNVLVRASGARVWDEDGNEFIDFLAGCGSINFGHNHPAMKRAVIDYLEADGIGNALDFRTRAKKEFMARFDEVILRPRGLPYVMQFTGPTGTNCVEAALKLARKATGRHTVVAFTNAFHGMSAGALSVTGSRKARRGLEAVTDGVVRLPFEGYHGAGIEELDRFLHMAQDPSGGIDPVAAIIVEIIQGEGGLNVASAEWIRQLRKIATELGAALIVDDIQAGCGRSGTFFSFEAAGIVPDMVCLSKSISGNGMPMALLLLRRELDVWHPGEHNGTFRGNSLAFVSAKIAVDHWENSAFHDGIRERAACLNQWLAAAAADYPQAVRRVKGIGMIAGLEFADARKCADVAAQARRDGLLIETCGPDDEVLKILAPLNIEMDLFHRGLAVLDRALERQLRIGIAA